MVSLFVRISQESKFSKKNIAHSHQFPNVQPSDINDVVNFERILTWVLELERSGQLKRAEAMRGWLTSAEPWTTV